MKTNLEAFTAAYMEACRGRAADHNEMGLHYAKSLWDAAIEHEGEALRRIDEWAKAYPLDVFPEPDLKRAHEVLEAAGLSLGQISAHAMRHVLTGVQKIAAAAMAG